MGRACFLLAVVLVIAREAYGQRVLPPPPACTQVLESYSTVSSLLLLLTNAECEKEGLKPEVCLSIRHDVALTVDRVNQAEAACLRASTAKRCETAMEAHEGFFQLLSGSIREQCAKQETPPQLCGQLEQLSGGTRSDLEAEVKRCSGALDVRYGPPGRVVPGKLATVGLFSAEYVEPRTRALRPVFEVVAQADLLGDFASSLNAWLNVEGNVTIATEECGVTNAFYDPSRRRISLCYELIHYLVESSRQGRLSTEVFGPIVAFFTMHEVGHALIHILDLPITGREEDAADQFAILALLGADDAGGNALGAATFFAANATWLTRTKTAYADEHSLREQRFYNVLCWTYGKHTEALAAVVHTGWIPASRAARCQKEFAQMKESWDRITEPFERPKEPGG